MRVLAVAGWIGVTGHRGDSKITHKLIASPIPLAPLLQRIFRLMKR